VIVDCEARIWDLRAVDFEDPDIASFWNAMMDHGRILTREREELHRLVTPADLVAMMDRQGIDHACMTSFAFPTVMGDDFDPGDLVVRAMEEHPGRITGYISLSPQLPGALEALERWAQRGHEQAVIATRVRACERAAGEAAEPVRHEPFAAHRAVHIVHDVAAERDGHGLTPSTSSAMRYSRSRAVR
jgi:hypothetical protein